jgi:hypothetical protein
MTIHGANADTQGVSYGFSGQTFSGESKDFKQNAAEEVRKAEYKIIEAKG